MFGKLTWPFLYHATGSNCRSHMGSEVHGKTSNNEDVTTFSSLKPLALVVSGGQLLLTHSHVKLFNILLNYTKRFLFFGQLAGTHFLQWHHKNHKQMPFKGWAQCQALQTRLSSAHRNPTMA